MTLLPSLLHLLGFCRVVVFSKSSPKSHVIYVVEKECLNDT